MTPAMRQEDKNYLLPSNVTVYPKNSTWWEKMVSGGPEKPEIIPFTAYMLRSTFCFNFILNTKAPNQL